MEDGFKLRSGKGSLHPSSLNRNVYIDWQWVELGVCDETGARDCFFDMEGTLLSKAHHLDDGRVAPSDC